MASFSPPDGPGQQQANDLSTIADLLRATLDSSMDMIQVFKAVRDDRGEIVDFKWILNNHTSEKIYGNVIGLSLLEHQPGVVQEGIFEAFKQVTETGEPQQYEKHYVHEQFDGWFHQSVVKLNDGVATTTANITSRKNAELEILRLKDKAAQNADNKYRKLVNSIYQGFALCELIRDENGRGVDHRILEHNHAFERQTGISMDILEGRTAREAFPTLDWWWTETYTKIVDTGEPMSFEHYLKETDRWYEIGAYPIEGEQFAVLYDDITGRKYHEKEQAFLLRLGDKIRPLTDPVTIEGEVTNLLREHFDAGWCYYVEWDEVHKIGMVRRDAAGKGLSSLVGEHDVSEVPEFLELLKANPMLNVSDYKNYETLTPELRDRYASLGFRSMLVATLVKQERLVASLLIGDTTIRDWSTHEESLLMQTAERTWSAIERVKAEETIRQSHVRIESIANLVPDLLWDSEPEGSTSWYNQRWLEYTGQTPEEAIGWGWVDAIHPDDRGKSAERHNRAVATGKSLQHEHRIRRHDGVYRWFVVSTSPVKDDTGRVIKMYGAATDIHDRREAEEALRANEEKFRSLFETMDQGFCIIELAIDANDHIADIIFQETNNAFERHTGIKNVTGKRASEVLPQLEQHWLDSMAHVYKTGEPVRVEGYQVDLGRWFSAHYTRVGGPGSRFYACVFNDISDRKQREQQQQYLIELNDALRPLSDPAEIQRAATQILGQHLKVDRVIYADINIDEDYFEAIDSYASEFVNKLTGRFSFSAFGSPGEKLKNGENLIIDDVSAYVNDNEAKQVFLSIHVHAVVAVPLIKNGKLVADLSVHQIKPRQWTESEIRMLEETAERTWAAVERIKAEVALRKSEELLSDMLQALPVGLGLLNSNGDLTIANKELYRFMPTGRMPSKDPENIWRWSAFNTDGSKVELHNWPGVRAARGETVVPGLEMQYVQEDGNVLVTQVSAVPNKDSEGNVVGLVVAITDITKRAKAEEALRISEAKFRRLIESGIVAVAFFDMGGPVTDANAAFLDLFGVTRDELQTEKVRWDVYTPKEWMPRTLQAVEELKQTGRNIPYEKQFYHTSGELRWGIFAGATFGDGNSGIALVIDITKRKTAEEALRKSETRLQLALEATDLAVYEWDLASDRLTTNQRFREMVGIGKDDSVIGAHIMEHVVHPDDRSHVDPALAKAMDSSSAGNFVFEHRLSFTGPLGQPWVLSHGQVFFTGSEGNRQPSRIFGTLQDITERKQRERRQQFLLRLSDNLGVASNLKDVQTTVTDLLREYYDAGWCYYVEWDEETQSGVVLYESRRENLTSLSGTHDISDIPEFLNYLRSGQILNVKDCEDYDLLRPEVRERYTAVGLRSMLVTSLVKQGKLISSLIVGDTKTRNWSSFDVALLTEVAELTWAAVERAKAEEALRKSEEKFRTLFNSIDEGFAIVEVITDEQGRITDLIWREANPGVERQSGISGWVGKRASEIVPHLEQAWLDAMTEVYQTGNPVRMESYNTDVDRWIETVYLRVGDAGSGLMASIFQDVTRRKRIEQQQAFLLALIDNIRPLQDAVQIQQTVAKALVDHLDLVWCYYIQVGTDGDTIFEMEGYSKKDPLQLPLGARISAFGKLLLPAYLNRKTVCYNDVESEPDFSQTELALYDSLNARACMAVPLIKDNRLVALLGIASDTPRDWRSDEISLAEELGERTWAAIESARIAQQVFESEKRLRIATEAADMATWEWDLVQNQVIWNERHFGIFGLEPSSDPVRPELFFEHIHPEDRARVDGLLRESLVDDIEFDTEFRAILEDGSERWMSGYGRVMERSGNQPISMSGVMFDITARRQAENDLHQIRERQAAIIESAKDYAIVALDLDLRVSDWNAGAEYMMGYREEEIVGQPGEIFFVPEDRAKGAPQLEMEKAIKEGRATNERWHVRKDGSRFYGSGVTTPLLDETGNVIGLVKVMRDLTDHKRGEDALKEASKRKDEFLAMLAHELRNPLSTVRNGLSVLKITQQANAQVSEIVTMMDNQATHLVRMIDDLLDVSRVTQGKVELKSERLDIGILIQNAVKAILPQYEIRGKKLHMNTVSSDLFIQGDATRLSQIVTNLLTNSLRYTGDDGQVRVSLSAENSQAVIRIEDNGIGLSAEQQTSVFELFVQADNSLARTQGGLGIGLTLVKQLVEMHGGRVEAKSPGIGQGSQFTVFLPLIDVPQHSAIEPSEVSAKHSSLQVLLIDDAEDLAKMTAMLLKLKGYQVDIRLNGKAGAEAVEALRPAVVLCDIGMPDLDGYETARLIRQGAWGQKVTLIALSGYGQKEDKERSKEAGFDWHLIKPVDMEELQKMIGNIHP